MSAKTIFIIAISVLLTIVLMNNNDEMSFWLFGEAKVSKLAILAGMFFLGWIIGFLMGRPKADLSSRERYDQDDYTSEDESGLSKEDRDYIS